MSERLRYIFSNATSGRPFCRRNIPEWRTKDNTCAVFSGTQVVFASETERFSGIKHDFRLPLQPLDAFCKHNAGVALEDFNSVRVELNHHLNHVYEAFCQSGFDDAAVIVNDGRGTQEDCVTIAYMKKGEAPRVFKKFSMKHSPCNVYNVAANRTFAVDNTEGKLMGLAAYGTNNGKTYIRFNEEEELIETYEDELEADLQFHHQQTAKKLPVNVMDVADVAFTVQQNFEDTLVKIVKHFHSVLVQHGITTENLCFSGGGVLNCPTNSRIVDLRLFKHYYASPQPNDGCAESIGKAYRTMELLGEKLEPQRLQSAYLGVAYSADDLTSPKRHMKHALPEICEHLKSGGIVAWCQDEAEYGPRALGHRSFLADPTSKDMLDALNKIKGREWWRPLAPIVPEELFSCIFDVENTDMCEFMLRTLKIKERWQPRLQAVCHVDGTTRPQLLKREVNPQLHDLLMAHFEQTHVPCLVNTSLNINGFPIVETPRDFCNLQEEITFIDNIPTLKFVFVDKVNFYEVMVPEKLFFQMKGMEA